MLAASLPCDALESQSPGERPGLGAGFLGSPSRPCLPAVLPEVVPAPLGGLSFSIYKMRLVILALPPSWNSVKATL